MRRGVAERGRSMHPGPVFSPSKMEDGRPPASEPTASSKAVSSKPRSLAQRLIKVMSADTNRDWSPKDLAKIVGESPTRCSTTLCNMRAAEQVVRLGRGRYRCKFGAPAPTSQSGNGVEDPSPYLGDRHIRGYLVDDSTTPLPWPEQEKMFRQLRPLRQQAWDTLLESGRFAPLVVKRLCELTKLDLSPDVAKHMQCLTHLHPRASVAQWCTNADPTSDFLRSIVASLDDATKDPIHAWPFLKVGGQYHQWLSRTKATVQELDELRSRLAAANIRLTMKLARARAGQGGMAFSDLVNEGFAGLLRAVDRFDVDRGLRFSTYAPWWIRHAIQRSLQEQGRIVRVPSHVQERSYKVYKARLELGEDDAAVSKRTGEPIERIKKIERVAQAVLPPHLSLNTPLRANADDEREFLDLLPSLAPSAETLAVAEDERRAVRDHLSRLPPVQREILCRRFGVGCKPETLRQIANDHGLSRERIRQLETGALQMLKGLITAAQETEPKLSDSVALLPRPDQALCERVLEVLEALEDRAIGCTPLAKRIGDDPWVVRRACVELVRKGHAVQVGRRFRYAPPSGTAAG